MRVLDLGCGTGFIGKRLLALGAAVVCFDLGSMLAQARGRCGDHAVIWLEMPIIFRSANIHLIWYFRP